MLMYVRIISFVGLATLMGCVDGKSSITSSNSSDSPTTTLTEQSTIFLTETLSSNASSSSSPTANSSDSPTTTLTEHSTIFLTETRTLNSSTAAPTYTPGPDACCFIVQDTVTEDYWLQYSTLTYYNVVNLTSITTLVTPYPTTTSTNIVTNVYTTNATFLQSDILSVNPISFYINGPVGAGNPSPVQDTNVLNATQIGSQVVTGGVTVASPQAFYVYNTVKVITVPAVTDSNGNVACGTHSGLPSIFIETSYSTTSVLETIYSITETLVITEYSTLTSSFLQPYSTYTTVSSSVDTFSIGSGIPESTYTTTLNEPTFYANQYVEAYFDSNDTRPTGVVISLTTPFVYLPSRGAQGITGDLGNNCAQNGGSIDYGYPPQTLLDLLVANPLYSSQYPGLASCFPGGPTVVAVGACSEAAPESENAGGDLTSSTLIVVTPEAIKTAGTSPESTAPTALPVSKTSPPQASSTPEETPSSEAPSVASSAPVEPQPSSQSVIVPSSALQPTPQSSTLGSVAPGSKSPPVESSTLIQTQPSSQSTIIPSSILQPTPQSSALGSVASGSKPPPVESSAVQPQPSSRSVIIPTSALQTTPQTSALGSVAPSSEPSPVESPPSGTGPLSLSGVAGNPPTQAVSTSVGSIIASLAGLQPISSETAVGGTTDVIISAATTISPSSVAQSLPGNTTLISGTLQVVITGSTTIPVNSALPGLTGSETVISGSTLVILTGPTTISVATGSSTSSPTQVTASDARRMDVRWYGPALTAAFLILAL